MKPMGMTREDYYDDDVTGCTTNGRPSGIYAIKGKGEDTRAYHSLRGGKKDSTRRPAKRRARREGRDECRDTGE